MRETVDAVLFDLDNTLIDFLEPLEAWAQAWATCAVPDRRDEVARALIDATLDGREDPERGLERVADRFDVNGRAQEATERAWAAYEEALTPYPGVCGLLAECRRRGWALGVVTDAPRERAWHRLHGTELAPAFQAVVARDDSPDGKAGPEPFHQALDALDVAPGDAAMVGDWPAYDVRWPRRLGMRAVLAGWGQDPSDPRTREEAPACPVAGAPSEVPGLLADPPAAAEGPRQARLAGARANH